MTHRSTVLHPLQQAGLSITALSSSVDVSAAAATCSSSSTRFDDGEQHYTHTTSRVSRRIDAAGGSETELGQ